MEKINPWTTLEKETRYENKWIKVVENKVLNPAGNEGIYGVVHVKDIAIAVIPLDDQYNTWIVGQYRYALESYEWEIIEGGCPIGESPLEAAKRELEEEAGIVALEYKQVLEMQLSNSKTDEISISYVAKNLSFTAQNPEETEVLSLRELPFSELVDMCLSGEIKDALSVATVLKVNYLIEKGIL